MNSISNVFDFFFTLITQLFNLLNTHCIFTVYGYRVGLGYFLLSLVFLSIIISVFWKGGRA